MKLEEVVVSKFSVQEVKLNNKTIILPKLNGVTLPDIKLPKTLLSHYGVPKIGQYFKKLTMIGCSFNYLLMMI